MRPTPLAARKAGAALAVLMLSTALAACQPDGSTDAAPSTTATASTESTDQTSAPTNGSTTSPADGSGSSTGTVTVPHLKEAPSGQSCQSMVWL